VVWWKAEAAQWMLDDLILHFQGKIWILNLVSLSGTFWTLGGAEVKPDGTLGPEWPIYWFDPPSGPP